MGLDRYARSVLTAGLAVLALAVLEAEPAAAQWLPSGPIVLAHGDVTISGDVVASMGPKDPGYFNYADYEHSTLRLLQIDLAGSARAGDHLMLLGQVRSQGAWENGLSVDAPDLFAFYLRIRPWVNRAFDLQVGRIPPTFGAFPRRSYGSDNFLVGYPLAYQYLTSLRPDSLPATADELLARRGRGWRTRFTIGNGQAEHGVPLATAFHWDTGIQAHAASELLEVTASLTTGSPSSPNASVTNGLGQLAGRIAIRPLIGLVIGASASHSRFLADPAADALPASLDRNSFTQRAFEADAEYSHGYYLLRVEVIDSRWTVPLLRANPIETPLNAVGVSVEGRYKIRPPLYVAGRFDHLDFSDIIGIRQRGSWEAPVSREEAAVGYALERNLQLRVAFQHNTRATTRATVFNTGAAQLIFWF